MTKLKLIVRYVYGSFCIIGALATFSSSALTAFLFVITGLFIIPKTHDVILEKLNITLDTPKRYFIAFTLFTISCFASTKIEDSNQPEKVVAKTEETTDKYLFESVSDFKDSFNEFAEKTSLEYKIEDIVVKKGEKYDSFNFMLNPHIGIIGQIDKENGGVINLTSLGSGDGTAVSVINVIAVFSSLIATVDNSLEPKQRLDIIKDLGLLNEKVNLEKLSDSTFVNGNRYYLGTIKGMGLMFNISKK